MLAVTVFAWPAAEGVNRVYADEGEHLFTWRDSVAEFTYSETWFYVLNNLYSEWQFELMPQETIESPEGYLSFALSGDDAALFEVTYEGVSEFSGAFTYHLVLDDSIEDLSPGNYTATLKVYEDPTGSSSFDESNPAWVMPVSLTVEPGEGDEAPGGWNATHTRYYEADGTPRCGWIEEPFEESGSSGVNWYYADPANDGIIATGWKKIGIYWYYFTPANEDGYGGGQLHQAGVEEINGKLYYLDRNNGRMRTSWIKEVYGDHDEYDWYYADASGVLQLGWRRIGGKWYYFERTNEYGPGGWMYKNDVYRINGKLYGFDEDGVMQYGWMKLNRPVYAGPGQKGYYSFWAYANASGVVQTGWKKISGSWYFFDDEGAMRTNMWVKDSAGWCYLGSNGKMLTNSWARDSVGWVWLNGSGRITKSSWLRYKGDWYYLKANGYMATGTQTIGGKTYKFDSQGRWIK